MHILNFILVEEVIIRKTLFFFLIYFWLCWVFIAACGFSLVAASGGYSSLQCVGFSLQLLLLLWSTGSRHAGFSSCGMWAQQLQFAGSRAQAQQLWRMGLVAPQHVGSFRTRAQTHVPCIGRWILNHCATREVPRLIFLWNTFLFSFFTMILHYFCLKNED